MKKFMTLIALAAASTLAFAAPKQYSVASPDGNVSISVALGEGITYSVLSGTDVLVAPSAISMTLSDGTVYGGAAKLQKVTRRSVDQTIAPVVYKKTGVRDHFNEMTLQFKAFSLVFRAYDDGVAYRFVSRSKVPFKVTAEQAKFDFAEDWPVYAAYSNASNRSSFESQTFCSFESPYEHNRLSEWDVRRLAFMPVVVEASNGRKVCVTEADIRHFPGMFLSNSDSDTSLEGYHPAVPDKVEQGGHNMLQGIVRSRKDYLAECEPLAQFPWRVVIVADEDKELLNSDMVFKLAAPADETKDWSWVRPGKVAWDWWNDWNIDGVDFESGINNDTYKYYIDFAAKNGVEYVILDEGWSVNLAADLTKVVPEIDLKLLADYAASKGVGLILWAGYWAFDRNMDNICKMYSEMGFKGFKVDFMDRNDQVVVDFYERAAATAAKYHMMLDFHGAYPPSGLNRTYPNIVNYEGVRGLENAKWSVDMDQVTYDVTIPYIRMVAGQFDYTQGAMRNATRSNYKPVNNEPMSQGTRCRQLAEYVIFESPLNMLCDSPSAYMREPECTEFIAAIPTVWDETIALDGAIAKYAAIARRSGDVWYVGALTDWSERDMTLDLGFLPEGAFDVVVYQDGANAQRIARDFAVTRIRLGAGERSVSLHMAPGGGWVAKIVPHDPRLQRIVE